jgi:hypothetical protein
MVYLSELDTLVAGCDDGSIRLHRLSGEACAPLGENHMPLPDEIKMHKTKVSGVCVWGGGSWWCRDCCCCRLWRSAGSVHMIML